VTDHDKTAVEAAAAVLRQRLSEIEWGSKSVFRAAQDAYNKALAEAEANCCPDCGSTEQVIVHDSDCPRVLARRLPGDE
jgi:hypothetical protein